MGNIIVFLLFTPMFVPLWVFLIAWVAFKVDAFRFLREEELDLPEWDDPIFKD